MRRTIILLSLLSLFGVLFGCSQTTPTPPAIDAGISVTDLEGRVVNLPRKPTRVISIAPAMTECWIAAGGHDSLVGITSYDNYPDSIQALPKVGDMINPNLETILSLKPELILTTLFKQSELMQGLEKQGIPVYASNPKTIEEVALTMEGLAKLTGQEAKPVPEFRKRVQAVRDRTANTAKRKTVLCIVSINPLFVVGPKTFIDDMLKTAGAANAVTEAGDYLQLNDEVILKMNPDILLLPDHGSVKDLPTQLRARPGWHTLTAIRENRIIVLPEDHISRPGPRLIEGLEALEKALR
ncbi:MAG: ABC transporter substrate-binding protein [Fimbriiglobus sp.]